tara:strand:+ start:13932 stop:14297 length:366 start_codon:yes stop_codon:yes gene_type:complete
MRGFFYEVNMTKQDWCKNTGGIEYVTTKPITWHIGKKNSGLIVVIPKGYPFQSSVPLLLWPVFSPHDPQYLWAACLHDWLLEERYRPAFAAGEWYDGAMAYHAPKWKTKIAHIGIFKHTVK